MQLITLYFQYLIKKRVFINCLLVLLVMGFLLIPSEKADYVTFSANSKAGIPNVYWIGNLAAIFSNLIISFLLIFIIINDRKKEIISNIYILEDISPLKKFLKISHKIFALYFVALFFLAILNLSLILSNFSEINLVYFLIPIVYFCLPYLFFFSVFCFILEYFVNQLWLKYTLYFSSTILFILNDQVLFHLFGVGELGMYLGQKNMSIGHFGFGYMKKTSNITLVTINHFLKPIFFSYKIFWIIISLMLIFIFSKFRISRKINIYKDNITLLSKKSPNISLKVLTSIPFPNFRNSNLWLKDLFLLSEVFKRLKIIIMVSLWILIILCPVNFLPIPLAFLFLMSISINEDFLCKLYFYNANFLEIQSPYSQNDRNISKFVILISFYIFLLLPLFLKLDGFKIFIVIIYFSILSIVQILITNHYKNSLTIDVIMIILFSTYLTGTPILNVFQL